MGPQTSAVGLKAVVLLLVLKTINVSSRPPRYSVTSHYRSALRVLDQAQVRLDED